MLRWYRRSPAIGSSPVQREQATACPVAAPAEGVGDDDVTGAFELPEVVLDLPRRWVNLSGELVEVDGGSATNLACDPISCVAHWTVAGGSGDCTDSPFSNRFVPRLLYLTVHRSGSVTVPEERSLCVGYTTVPRETERPKLP